MDFDAMKLKLWNYWPPFFGAGIRIASASPGFKRVRVELKKRPWTANYVGTQFGGSMFAMTDAFFMVMLIRALGPGYVIWDKEATIRYLKPGRSKLHVDFEVKDSDLAQIHAALAASESGKIDWVCEISIFDEAETEIAQVRKTLFIGDKSRRKPKSAN